MTVAVQAAPCWQGGFTGAGWRSLPGISVIRGAAVPKLRPAPAGFWSLDMDSGDREGAISGVNGALGVCICQSACILGV